MSRCRGCRYAYCVDIGADGEMLFACCYILKTGKRRPCPPGAGCTVYTPKRRAAFRFGRRGRY